MEIRLLSDHRDDLVAERTKAQNRLRWHLLELCPELEASLPKRSLDREAQLDRIASRLRPCPAAPASRSRASSLTTSAGSPGKRTRSNASYAHACAPTALSCSQRPAADR